MYHALVSPDGQLVAFDDSTGLYVDAISGSGPGRLVTRNVTPTGDARPYYVWSPDSKQLLVTTRSGRLAVVTVASGAERLLPRPEDPSLAYYPFGWSGPAHTIFFESTCIEQGWHDCWGTTLVAASPTGASPRTIYDYPGGNSEPGATSSPDGKWLFLAQVVDTEEGGPDLAEVIDVESGKPTELQRGQFDPDFPVWAPDSSRFVISGQVPGVFRYVPAVRMYSNGGDLLRSVNPSWSPIAWTRAGLYLRDDSGKLLLVPRGRTKAKAVSSRLAGEVLTVLPPG
jgi:Tol biopolymer transport system component